jgi:tRNA (guanine26-N2/guanine27-N2)-dimethyltransferase
MKKIVEGAAVAMVPTTQKVSKEMEVFYNPVMKLNRDISLLLLEVLGKERKRRTEWEGFTIGSPLAGSGIRECRMLVELSPETIKSIEINDYDEKAAELIKKNIVLNEQRLNCDEIEVSCTEASKFLLDSFGHGYIEIDPFGTPNPFLDAAVKRIQREGILAVTATDTSALSGTYEDSCRRKYWAKPMRNHLMHDVGLRILIRKVQLIGTQYEKSLIPIYSYAKDHYMRVFFLCQKQGKKVAAAVVKKHQYIHYCPICLSIKVSPTNESICCGKTMTWAGPAWVGSLWDAKLAAKMAKLNARWEYGQTENQKFLETIAEESKLDAIGFYPFNLIRKVLKKTPRKKEELLALKSVAPTHFESNSVKAKDLSVICK